MFFRFVGEYTNGRTSIVMNGVKFEGRTPSEVPEKSVARFSSNREFEKAARKVRGLAKEDSE